MADHDHINIVIPLPDGRTALAINAPVLTRDELAAFAAEINKAVARPLTATSIPILKR